MRRAGRREEPAMAGAAAVALSLAALPAAATAPPLPAPGSHDAAMAEEETSSEG